MVARHEMPGNATDMIRPVGNGMTPGCRRCPPCKTIRRLRQSIIPYPTGRTSPRPVSRHFMPGYLHFVPPGQRLDYANTFFHRSATNHLSPVTCHLSHLTPTPYQLTRSSAPSFDPAASNNGKNQLGFMIVRMRLFEIRLYPV